MRCVKLTFPPRERARWLLMTTRLSMSSLAGTERTLVAVGTVSEVSMLATTRCGAPRRRVTWSSLTGPAPLAAGTSRGLGSVFASAGCTFACAGCGFGCAGCGVAWVFASVFVSVFAWLSLLLSFLLWATSGVAFAGAACGSLLAVAGVASVRTGAAVAAVSRAG